MRTKCYQRVFLAKEGLGCVAIFLVVFDDIVIVVVVDDNVGMWEDIKFLKSLLYPRRWAFNLAVIVVVVVVFSCPGSSIPDLGQWVTH